MADVSQQAAKPGGRLQIGPRLTPATKELLDQACATRMLSVSELVEHALLAYLARNPLCQCDENDGAGCGRAATVVDHRTPHNGDPALLYAWDNLQSMTKVDQGMS